MSPEDMEMVRRSFHKVATLNARVGAQFCERLLDLDPGTRVLFGDDPGAKAETLVAAFSSAVRHLSNPAALEAGLRALGEHHRRCGLGDAHYAIAGEALLSTLAVNLGPDFTPAVREAWQALYEMLVRMMRGPSCTPCAAATETAG